MKKDEHQFNLIIKWGMIKIALLIATLAFGYIAQEHLLPFFPFGSKCSELSAAEAIAGFAMMMVEVIQYRSIEKERRFLRGLFFPGMIAFCCSGFAFYSLYITEVDLYLVENEVYSISNYFNGLAIFLILCFLILVGITSILMRRFKEMKRNAESHRFISVRTKRLLSATLVAMYLSVTLYCILSENTFLAFLKSAAVTIVMTTFQPPILLCFSVLLLLFRCNSHIKENPGRRAGQHDRGAAEEQRHGSGEV